MYKYFKQETVIKRKSMKKHTIFKIQSELIKLFKNYIASKVN